MRGFFLGVGVWLLLGGLPGMILAGAAPEGEGAGRIQGRIEPPEARGPGLSIWLFDGFSLHPVPLTPSGTFETPSRTTEGTWQVLLAIRPGWRPVVVVVPGGKAGWRGVLSLESGEGALQQGIVGVVYLAAAGGRLRPVRGIYRLFPGREVVLEGPTGLRTTQSGEAGSYWFSVEPGTYRLSLRGHPAREVAVAPGEVRVVPLAAGRLRID